MTTLPNIAITGCLRSGKDTVAEYLAERYGYVRFAFGDGIRDVCRQLFADRFTDEAGNDVKPRSLLQGVGQALRAFDEDVWVRSCFDKIAWDEDGPPAVITDLRQPNEYERCRAEGFVIIRVKAPSGLRIQRAVASADTFALADLTHETEQYTGGFEVDYEITNDGKLQELYAKVDAIMRSLADKH